MDVPILTAFPVVKKEMPLRGRHEAVDNYASAVRCSASQKAQVISLRLEQIIGCPAGKRAPQSF